MKKSLCGILVVVLLVGCSNIPAPDLKVVREHERIINEAQKQPATSANRIETNPTGPK